MRVLIVGGSGFIGNHLAEFLTSNGYEVHVLNRSKKDSNVFMEYVLNTLDHPINEILKQHQFDLCINCAGSANVSYSFEHPFFDYELNTRIVFNILSAIHKISPRTRFINLSSAAVYGNPNKLPIAEETKLEPVSPYGNHKLMSEMICQQFKRYFDIESCSLRIFSAYGPGLKKQLLFDICNKLKSNSHIELFGTGEETRDFIYIDDLVRAIKLVGDQDKFKHDSYNIGSGKQVSIKEIANVFIENHPSCDSIHFNMETRIGDPLKWEADISRLKKLGFNSEIDINKGVKAYIDWYNSI